MDIGFLYAIGAAIAWGLVYSIDQKILANTSPVVLLFIYSILGALIILPFVIFGNGSAKASFGSTKVNFPLIIVAAIIVTTANFLILSAIKHLNAYTASVIEIAYPFFVVLFSIIFFKAVPNLYFFVGGILIFLGSIIIIKFA